MPFRKGELVRHRDMPKLRHGVVVADIGIFVGVVFPGDASPGLYCAGALEPDRLEFDPSWLEYHL